MTRETPFKCPVCDFTKPHTHDDQTLQWFEEAKTNPRYHVDMVRRSTTTMAENLWTHSERQKEFFSDPLGVLKRGQFAVDKGRPWDSIPGGQSFWWYCSNWIIEVLEQKRSAQD